MHSNYIKLHIKQIIFFLALGSGILVGLALIDRTQDIRNRAAGGATVTLSLSPVSQDIPLGDTQLFLLNATFTGGSPSETLDYLRTQIEFNPSYLELPSATYIDTVSSGFDHIFRVDGPQTANGNGKIIIELGSKTRPGPSTATSITIAKIYFRGKSLTLGTDPQVLTLTSSASQIVNNASDSLVFNLESANYRVIASLISPTPTSTLTPTITPTRTPTPGPSSPTPTSPPSCPRGASGNLDCSLDGCIDTSDFELFRQGYGQLASSLSIPSYHHTPDLIVDAGGFVDTADYNILYQNFGSCTP